MYQEKHVEIFQQSSNFPYYSGVHSMAESKFHIFDEKANSLGQAEPLSNARMILSIIPNDVQTERLKIAATKHVQETLPSLLRSGEKPSEILSFMTSVSLRECLQDEILKEVFVESLPIEIQYPLRDKMRFCTTHQLAHMADIHFKKVNTDRDKLFFITDPISDIKFLIDSGSAASYITTTYDERIKLNPIYWIQGPKGIIAIYGNATLTVDLGIGRQFTWNFLIADIKNPIIGADFLTNFDILIDLKRKKLIPSPYPLDPGGDLKLAAVKSCQTGLSECMHQRICRYLLLYLKPSVVLQQMRPCLCISDDFWKRLLQYVLPQSFQYLSTLTIYELASAADRFHSPPEPNRPARLCVRDKNSGMWFLIDTGACCSLIPPLPNETFSPTTYGRLFTASGVPVSEYGQKYLTVDFGLGKNFTWSFIIADIEIPLIGADFLSHFEIVIDLKTRALFR